MTTPLGDALVRASKLVNRYPHLPAPRSSHVQARQDGQSLTLHFARHRADGTGPGPLAGLRELSIWAESFGAWVTFEASRATTEMGIEGRTVMASASLFGSDRLEVSRLIGMAYNKIRPLAATQLLTYLDGAILR